jgi:hypothetical protein
MPSTTNWASNQMLHRAEEVTENETLQAVNGITIKSGIAGGEAIAEWQ